MSTENKQNATFDAFILTRQWHETDAGLELTFWLASAYGPLRWRVPDQEAVCFVADQDSPHLDRLLRRGNLWRSKSSLLKDFSGQSVLACYCKSQRAVFEARDKLAAKDIFLLEADIKPTDRYLMERFITGSLRVTGSLSENGGFFDLTPEKIDSSDYRPVLRALSIDIETDYQASSLYSIGVYSDTQALVLMIGDTGEHHSHPAEASDPELRYYPDEKTLLQAFVELCKELDPDVLIGWNVVNFDLVCLQEFADRLSVPLTLGRNDQTINWRQARDNANRRYALVPGRVVLDGIELMRTATYSFENFSLDHVAQQLLQRGKLIDDVDQRGAEITDLFQHDKLALARYNVEDCRLVWDIFHQENLLDFAIERSLLTGLEPDRYGGSVAAFDFLYLPRLHRQGYVAPALEQLGNSGISPGGYVMESVPGIHDNVIVLDFKSLYPSIIRTFGVDPLGLIKGLEEADSIEGFDGGRFSRQHNILPQLIERLWAARDKAKQNNNAELSQAIKIIMNSFYGVLGTSACRFFDTRLVSSITRRGHDIIIQSKDYIEEQGFDVIYGDTDSVFVLLGPLLEQTVAEIGNGLASSLNTWWRDKLRHEYDITSNLEIEFETHFQRFLMPRIRGSEAGSKKRYAGLVAGDRLVFKGLESVRSDWSPLAREFQQELFRRIFKDEPFEDYVKSVVAGLLAGDFEAKLVLRKRLRRQLSDYVKNVPPHVQAARKAEAIRAERDLPSLYDSGGWIEYVMTTGGPEPKQYRQSPIDFEFYLDRQLAPIADSVLGFKSSSFDAILNQQIGLF